MMPLHPPLSHLLDTCDHVEDAEEETFDLFAQQIPSSNLGFIDAKAAALDLEIGQKSFSVSQSPGLLNSDRAGGTTGAVLWKVTPLVAQWLTEKRNVFWKHGVLSSDAIVAELGCGISGLIGLALHDLVKYYILTDQAYIMKTLKQNVEVNANQGRKQSKKSSHSAQVAASNLYLLPFDWEADSAANINTVVGPDNHGVDLLIACDCIYNDFLIVPFVQACKDVCQLRLVGKEPGQSPTVLLVAQQQRSDEVFEGWLKETMKWFKVWRLPDDALPDSLTGGNGYIVHIAVLKEEIS